MTNAELCDDQWKKIYAFLQQRPRTYAGKEAECRQFVEAVLWILRIGGQWRLLPESHGQWNSIYKRFAHWFEHGAWEDMHQHFANDPDMENILLESTIPRKNRKDLREYDCHLYKERHLIECFFNKIKH